MKKVFVYEDDCCSNCPMFNSYLSFCQKTKQFIPLEKHDVDDNEEWCPLRALPEKEEYSDIAVELGSYVEGYDNGYSIGYTSGRNECIDEITGGDCGDACRLKY